jgi:hypothetical protein
VGRLGGRLVRYLARHHWGILAAFIALGGTAYASGVLPPNSVGTLQIRNGAVTASKVAPPPPLIRVAYVGERAIVSFSGWEDYGPPYAPGTYYRDDQGVVHLDGVAKSADIPPVPPGTGPWPNQNLCGLGGGSTMLILPAGYRPKAQEIFAVDSGDAHGRVDVLPNGSVVCVAGAGDRYVSLDGISFRAGS